jgi:hypothetical protein
VPLSLALSGVADVGSVCVSEIRPEKFIGWRDWFGGVTTFGAADHPHRTKTLQSLVHGGAPLRENQLLSTVQAGSGSSRCSD